MPIPLGILAVAGAGGAAGAFDLLETQVLGTAVASVSFSGLGSYSAYKHLQIRAVVRSDRATPFTAVDVFARLNSDTGSNYRAHRLSGSGSSVSSFVYGSTTGMGVVNIPTSTNTANIFSPFVVDLLDFSNVNKNTTIRALGGNTGSSTNIGLNGGLWVNTAAVTSILFFPDSSNFVAGSRFSLYGVK